MKKIKMISLLTLFVLVAGSFFIFAKRPVDNKPETVMVKTFYHGNGLKADVTAWVDYGNGKIENTELVYPFKVSDAQSNGSKIIEIVQKLNNQGYKVISHSESGVTPNETWVLTLK